MHEPGEQDGNGIEDAHGNGQANLCDDVWGSEDGGDEENNDDGEAPVGEKRAVCDEAEAGQKEAENGHFKDDAEGEDETRGERKVRLHGDLGRRREIISLSGCDEGFHAEGQDKKIAEEGTSDENGA